jgi:RNA polymerase sigma factor (sigma-70 family)
MSAVMDGMDSFDGQGRMVQLFLSEYGQLLKYFASRIGRPEDARDLVHEMYLRLIGIPQERVIEQARAYLWMVAKSVLCKYLERRGRLVAVDVDDPLVEDELAEEAAYDSDIDTDARLELLREKFALLPAKCRAVMELKWQHTMSYREIAGQAGISVDTVKKHLKVGLKLLRHHMQQLE